FKYHGQSGFWLDWFIRSSVKPNTRRAPQNFPESIQLDLLRPISSASTNVNVFQFCCHQNSVSVRQLKKGASQFLEGSVDAVWGKRMCHLPFRQNVSNVINASSPVRDQNCPGRLNRHCYCRHVDSIGPLPHGSPRLAPSLYFSR